ncbi:HlyD family secretion protein [Paracoccus marinaquae]|uniref:HlyD family efflux transporter periplasmic adaptor subunit n=1 Tax=Paracoccus marinaquae TaxID=2841926 RepID=A0ABS6AMR6_9RHOB|nr:HlyD family efflux transporter periplasmic adaptor subunit [Paracoccus marinaquae]MBU3030954.1 HlyD family efflux transporter periplasmic adaptor subunit [Paracoccus marinaquae]
MADLLCAIGFLAALLPHCQGTASLATGYVEGEYVQIAPLTTARITRLEVSRGDRVQPGQLLAAVEEEDARIALAAAEAARDRAASDLANLEQGSREPELAAIKAALASAEAQAGRTAREAERQERLLTQRVTSQAQLDAARAAADMATAAVAEAEARLATAQLPARPHQIAAAQAALAQAEASRDAAAWHLTQRQLTAGAPGIVTDILRRPGEVAGPAAPVLGYLPDGAVKLRLYLPEAELSSIAVGDELPITCDGCTPSTATVTYIADRAEFTPPVIYSRAARQKLVYLVEARPDGDTLLKPGQIVDIGPLP